MTDLSESPHDVAMIDDILTVGEDEIHRVEHFLEDCLSDHRG